MARGRAQQQIAELYVNYCHIHLKAATLVAMASPTVRAETSPPCCWNRAITRHAVVGGPRPPPAASTRG